jgi:hypothetical protein
MERPDLKQALGRLLGPAEPEVACDVCFDELDRYVELEVAGQDADAAVPGLRAHLAGCPACREEHDSLYALRGEQILWPERRSAPLLTRDDGSDKHGCRRGRPDTPTAAA